MQPFFKSVAVLSFVLSSAAFAKTPTHQCTKDGVVVQKKKKVCVAEGGKWELIPVKAAPH